MIVHRSIKSGATISLNWSWAVSKVYKQLALVLNRFQRFFNFRIIFDQFQILNKCSIISVIFITRISISTFHSFYKSFFWEGIFIIWFIQVFLINFSFRKKFGTQVEYSSLTLSKHILSFFSNHMTSVATYKAQLFALNSTDIHWSWWDFSLVKGFNSILGVDEANHFSSRDSKHFV